MSASDNDTPLFLRQRAWWLIPLAGWAIAVGFSLVSHVEDLRRHTQDVATEGARNMFRMIVLARAWNAEHGGVYVPVSPKAPPNPYLEHPRRDITTTDGTRLTMINPAYMTRLIAEMAEKTGGTVFHITSLNPIRPKNTPDPWERTALEGFEKGQKEKVEVVTGEGGEQFLRYMAPLRVAKPCMTCHEKQGYKVGDVRGGISVSVPYAPIMAAAEAPGRQDALTHVLVFLVVVGAGWWLLEQLRRRWLDLVHHIEALDTAHHQLQATNDQLAHARDAAETAARAKSMFLANMSHELRTPLNSVIGMTHLLLQDAKDPDEKEFLAQISASGQQLNSLIGDLLDLARLDAGDLRLETAAFDLRDIVDSVIGELDAEARSKNLAVTADVDPSFTRSLRGDAARLRQALSHLAGNAVKFTRQGGIVIRALRDTASGPLPRLRIEVEDTGIGIPPDTLARLFRPFEQADGSTTRAHGGSGLGLALSRQLAHLMGGRVGVRSVPGQGSTFWLDLPLVEEQTVMDGESDGPMEGPSHGAGEADSPIDWPAARALLDRLEDLLITDDFRAATLLREAAGPLRAALGPAAGQILDAIADYRFDEALDALRRARMNSPELREEAD